MREAGPEKITYPVPTLLDYLEQACATAASPLVWGNTLCMGFEDGACCGRGAHAFGEPPWERSSMPTSRENESATR